MANESKPLILTIDGKTIECEPCPKHFRYFEAGYLVVSCKKCVVRRIPAATPTEEKP